MDFSQNDDYIGEFWKGMLKLDGDEIKFFNQATWTSD